MRVALTLERFGGVASKVPKSMVCALLLKGPKGGLGENREGKSANRTPVEAKQGVRSQNDEKAMVFDMFLKSPGFLTFDTPPSCG